MLADEQRNLERLWTRRADAVALIPNLDAQDRTNAVGLRKLADRGVPIVQLVNAVIPGIPAAIIDRACAAHQATEHLLSLGHRRVAVLAPATLTHPPTPGNVHQHEFIRGYTESMEEAGLEPIQIVSPFAVHGWAHRDRIAEHAADLARFILDHPAQPTAVVSLSSILLITLSNGLLNLGVPVPDRISLVTTDSSGVAELVQPPLTTVTTDEFAIGRAAGRMLLKLIDGKPVENECLEPRLVVRGSTGPAARIPS